MSLDPNAQAIRAQQLDKLAQLFKFQQLSTNELRRAVLEAYCSGLTPEAIVTAIILCGPE